jgi:FkbM family methyltransferase
MLQRLWEKFQTKPAPRDALDFATLRKLIGKRDPVILDIGANSGGEVLQFLKLFPKASIYCFEPDARAQESFRRRVKSDRVQLFEMAIGSIDGVVDFNASGGAPPPELGYGRTDWDLSGSIRKPKGHYDMAPWVKFDSVVQVPINRLDTWATTHGVTNVDFIWADVQGAEGDLIEGGRETLKRTRFFYTEYHDHELYEGQITFQQLLAMLPEFEIVQRFSGDVLLRNTAL